MHHNQAEKKKDEDMQAAFEGPSVIVADTHDGSNATSSIADSTENLHSTAIPVATSSLVAAVSDVNRGYNGFQHKASKVESLNLTTKISEKEAVVLMKKQLKEHRQLIRQMEKELKSEKAGNNEDGGDNKRIDGGLSLSRKRSAGSRASFSMKASVRTLNSSFKNLSFVRKGKKSKYESATANAGEELLDNHQPNYDFTHRTNDEWNISNATSANNKATSSNPLFLDIISSKKKKEIMTK